MKCDTCNKQLIKLEREYGFTKFDEEATEGQMADYFSELESDTPCNWGEAIVTYYCAKCEVYLEIASENLKNYDSLIMNWHLKAKEGDYFSRFVFEYLAFNALLKCSIAISSEYDRQAIQVLKRNKHYKKAYLAEINKSEGLRKSWQEVIQELAQAPLLNSSRDYDNPEIDGKWNDYENNEDSINRGKGQVHSLLDWENMIEFWYGVRNNLFHAGKSPSIKRDCFMVEHAFITMRNFVEIVINLEKIKK